MISYWFNTEDVNQKINSNFEEKKGVYERLTPLLPKLSEKYSWDTKKLVLHIYDFLNYKFQNEKFYDQNIPPSLQIKVKVISNNSFTWQEYLSSIQELKKNYTYWSIENEYLSYIYTITSVWLLLNHQDFQSAEKNTREYFGTNKEKIWFIIQNSNYYEFSTLVQLASWIKEDTDTLLKERFIFYPEEQKSAFNITRQSKWNFKKEDCESMDIIEKRVGLIDSKFCKLLTHSFEEKDIDDLEGLNGNIQNLSDRINYYSYVGKYHTELQDAMENKKEELAKEIIKHDPHFMNWYLALIRIYDNEKRCDLFDTYYSQMKENYIGDQEKKNFLFGIEYINCWK